ncbi:MAG: hypothetical protein H6585_07700 [Flavobacteriales bacterium]|nr:hypothetical protein [Flavobacteriales bacterium]MCB9448210.1 hypothetical protein [Flavobacteriales bacterium]
MDTKPQPSLQDLIEIRSMMERSSRFISLSGLSGIAAGVCALIGATVTYFLWGKRFYPLYELIYTPGGALKKSALFTHVGIAVGVLIAALLSGIFFTTRKAKKQGIPVWGTASKRLVVNLTIPLVTGGFFICSLAFHQLTYLAAPCTLIFYGLALLNASKYTLDDIRYLGLSEIMLGLVACVFTGYSLLFWAIGFGVMHIVYGITMYRKYDI